MKEKILLVIDLQREFGRGERYEEILQFVKSTKDYTKIIGTVFMNVPNSPFVKYLGYEDCMDSLQPLDYEPDEILFKSGYGISDYSKLNKNCRYDIVGYNTDACILKIALDLFDRGYDFRVLGNYCYTSEGEEIHESALKILKGIIGSALILN